MRNLFVCAVFTLLFSGCNKYDNVIDAAKIQVPPYTETGANTFGCMVNGKPWANFGKTYRPTELFRLLEPNKVRTSIDFTDSVFYISGSLTVSKNDKAIREEYMTIAIPYNRDMKGIHKLSEGKYIFSYQDFLHTNIGYSSRTRNPFTVTVNKDSSTVTGHIVSGVFNGTLYNRLQTDSIKITGGVFDTVL